MTFRTLVLFALTLAPAVGFGQAKLETAVNISGRVVDPVGTAIWHAKITLKEVGGGEVILYSDKNGDFTFSSVSPKTHELVVEAPYFLTATRGPLQAVVGGDIRVGTIMLEFDKKEIPIVIDTNPLVEPVKQPLKQQLDPRAFSLPRFDDLRVATPMEKRTDEAFLAWPDGPDETPAHFRDRIQKAGKDGPDFAGHYAVVRAGCGSNCNKVWIVDVQTGTITNIPFLGATRCFLPFTNEPLFSYRLDSRLLIVTGSQQIPDGKASWRDGPCGRYYYRLDGRRLTLIRSVAPIDGRVDQ